MQPHPWSHPKAEKFQRQQTFLTHAVTSHPSLGYNELAQMDMEVATDFLWNESRLDIYRSDYYARLLDIAKESVLEGLFVRYPEIAEDLLRSFLMHVPHTYGKIEAIFEDLPRYCSLLEPEPHSFIDDCKCLLAYYKILHYSQDHEIKPEQRHSPSLNQLTLRSNVLVCIPENSQSDLYSLLQAPETPNSTRRGVLACMITPTEPMLMSIDAAFFPMMRCLKQGGHLHDAVMTLSEDTPPDDLTLFVRDLSRFME